ncbi:Trehalose-phosphatase, partial [Globisporangium splendens]
MTNLPPSAVSEPNEPTGAAMPFTAVELGESALLDQLHDLHRRLAAVRQDSQRYNSAARNIGPIPMANESNKIIVCSLQRCVRMVKTNQDDSWQYIPSDTGFKSAIEYLSEGNNVQWISWPGAVIDDSSQDGVRRKLESEYNCRPVFLTNEMLDLFHNQFCNEILWSLFHSLPQRSDSRLLENFADKYESYVGANQKFLDAVSEIYKDGDLVLVCDYQLMNLSGLLRRRFPDITCGFYFHSPFPSSEFFQMLPAREALLHGVLGADLVVFNHFDYIRHFLNVCTRMLGLESSPSRVEYNGRLISLGICPMGIDPLKYEVTSSVLSQIEALKKQQQDVKIIIGVHKLDFCKGIPEMLEAMDYLLQHYPEYRGKVVLFAVVREAGRTASSQYQMLNRQINELVGRVNGKFSTAEYTPVRYLQRSIDHDQLVALYNSADVGIITSIKEGINLQAMEFIAAQKDTCRGVLVYSEFAGCASSFQGALLVNPMHIEQVAASIDTALKMSTTTKRIRHQQLSRYVNTYTSTLWAQRIMSALNEAAATAQEYNRLEKLDTTHLLGYYERSQRRLFLLDYDGTLVNYQSMAELAEPSPALLASLEELSADPHNAVYIISGHNKSRLQEWFGHLSRVGLAAEHGYWFRPAAKHPAATFKGEEHDDALSAEPTKDDAYTAINGNLQTNDDDTLLDADGSPAAATAGLESVPWQCMFSDVELEWRDEVESILEHFTERTPGSLLDIKDCSYTWHFRDADPTFGLKQAKDLQLHFDQMLRDRPVGIVMCRIKKYVTIRPWRVNKGRAVSRILEYESETPYFTSLDFDFILAVGDERTDEDMFNVVQGSNCYTCTVGHKVSRAQYYLDDPDDVLRVLTAMTSLQSPVDRQALSA